MRTRLTDRALDSSASCSVTRSVVELMAINDVNGMEKAWKQPKCRLADHKTQYAFEGALVATNFERKMPGFLVRSYMPYSPSNACPLVHH